MSTSGFASRNEGDEGQRSAIPLELEHTPLWEELSQHLEQHGKLDLQSLREELDRSPWRTSAAGEAVYRCLERNDASELLTLAHRLGREWLAAG